MSKKYNVAIVGASGSVGKELIQILGLKSFPVNKLTLMASSRSAGKQVDTFLGKQVIKAFSTELFNNQDFVFFATSGEHAKKYAPEAVAAGAVVIDNSSAFRLDDAVPLVVPEVNGQAALNHQGIIANPNCSTIQMMVTLNPLYQVSKITRIVVSTYQAVSGAGEAAIKELNQQLKALVNNESINIEAFTKQIACNVIPHIDVFQDNGYTKEEMKMVDESKKILADPNLKITANCVRVPVIRAHSEAINIETQEYIGAEKARSVLSNALNIEVVDEQKDGGYPTPIDATQSLKTYVGRIREDISCENGLALWCVSDQLWKGAALNAVQIAELLIDSE